MAKKQKHHEEEAGEAWLLPYSDLMTLLLALFIALYATAQVDSEKLEALGDAFKGYLVEDKKGDKEGTADELPEGVGLDPSLWQSVSDGDKVPSSTDDGSGFKDIEYLELSELQNQLTEIAKEESLDNVITTSIDERGLIVSLSTAILFESGSAEINEKNKEILVKIGETLNKLPNYIRIEGHTDNVPIGSGSKYPDNWELSGARASSVARLFSAAEDDGGAGIDIKKLSIGGYADSQPVADNDTEEGREKNRRVDLILLSSKYNALASTEHDAPEITGIGTTPAQESELAVTTGGADTTTVTTTD